MQYKWIVTAKEANLTLLAFLQGKFTAKDYSMRKMKGWIDAGYCKVKNKVQRFYRTEVAVGDTVALQLPKLAAPQEIKIVYEDDDIVVIDKPVATTCDERLVKELATKNRQVELVHRLDKDTTGLLICAKNGNTKKYFIEQFRSLAVEKGYLAIVDGVVQKESGTIENYVGPIERYQGHVKWGVVPKDGHYAKTLWKVIKRAKNATLIELEPKTGKTHQLRLHASGMGHPILGDHTYGIKFRCHYSAPRVLLHAQKLRFIHPKTLQPVDLEQMPPEDFQACLKELF